MRKFTVALIVVGGLAVVGGAAAASKYIITSIHQIRPRVVAQLRGHKGPAGLRGPQGAPGPRGAAGLTAVKGYISSVVDATACCTSTSAIAVTATCPAGTTAVSGGWVGDPSHEPFYTAVVASGPSGSNGWTVIMINEDQQNPAGIQTLVTCALGSLGAKDIRSAGDGSTSMRAALAAAERLVTRGTALAHAVRR